MRNINISTISSIGLKIVVAVMLIAASGWWFFSQPEDVSAHTCDPLTLPSNLAFAQVFLQVDVSATITYEIVGGDLASFDVLTIPLPPEVLITPLSVAAATTQAFAITGVSSTGSSDAIVDIQWAGIVTSDNPSPTSGICQFSIQVGASNSPPELDPISDQTVNEGGSLSIPLTAFDLDGDNISLSSSGLPGSCMLIYDGNGTGSILCFPGFGDSGTFTISVIAADDGSPNLSDSETFTLTVVNVNRAPVLDPIDDQTVNEGGTISIPVTATDLDGDGLQFVITNAPEFCILTDNNDGTGSIDCAPVIGDFGIYVVTVTVSDDDAIPESDSGTVTITVNAVNSDPDAMDDVATTDEDTAVTIDVLANDTDFDGDSLSIAEVTQPSNGTVVNNGTDVTYTPDADFNGTDSFTTTISDGNGGTDTATVTVTVVAVNDDPRNVVSSGPNSKVTKNLDISGRGQRLSEDATTDVWALGNYAYTGTFNNPCGGQPDAGVFIWDVRNPNSPEFVGVIPSPVGSRAEDVKVVAMNSGDILVHSNEVCGDGGVGGFEIWNVDDPQNPVFQYHVGPIDEINPISDALFGGVTDVGVHNLSLFTNGGKDYVAAVAGSIFDNFRIYDITDPANPIMVSAWGAEEIFDPGVGDEVTDVIRVLNAADWLGSGFGNSQNRFLHDITVTADGSRAYLSNWDAGLVLLDISDPSSPVLVSVALNPTSGSLDGEVNSHAAWPSEDGSIVVEAEEDLSAWEASIPPSNLTLGDDPTNNIPATAISTLAGDAFESSLNNNSGFVDDTAVTVTSGSLAGQSFRANELLGNQPKLGDVGSVSGNLIWIGSACPGDTLVNPIATGDIAVVRRGACAFSEKLFTAESIGASAIVIANNVSQSTPWSGLRIWDYSDPASPVLASTFNTVCSAALTPGTECDPYGTYSAHNVIVEKTGKTTKAYISWNWDGMLVLDISDPYNPVETSRYFDNSSAFLVENGGKPHDFWGVYKQENSPWIYASDRNGGLYIFKEYGAGRAQN